MPYPPLSWHTALDSTNAEALRTIDAGTAVPHGWAVAAETQTAGRGQRGRTWTDAPGESLLLSTVVAPAASLDQQPLFSFGIASAVADALEALGPLSVSVKWPNDLYIGDRKVCGILIENILRGSRWQYAVVGTGVNLKQAAFPPALAHAVSLRMVLDTPPPARELAETVRDAVSAAAALLPDRETLARYNARLYRRGLPQTFRTAGTLWTGVVEGAEADGRLRVLSGNGHPVWCTHGVDEWVPLPG